MNFSTDGLNRPSKCDKSSDSLSVHTVRQNVCFRRTVRPSGEKSFWKCIRKAYYLEHLSSCQAVWVRKSCNLSQTMWFSLLSLTFPTSSEENLAIYHKPWGFPYYHSPFQPPAYPLSLPNTHTPLHRIKMGGVYTSMRECMSSLCVAGRIFGQMFCEHTLRTLFSCPKLTLMCFLRFCVFFAQFSLVIVKCGGVWFPTVSSGLTAKKTGSCGADLIRANTRQIGNGLAKHFWNGLFGRWMRLGVRLWSIWHVLMKKHQIRNWRR